jgi:hypothetical protein
MSTSNSAAIRRRANPNPSSSLQQQTNNVSNNAANVQQNMTTTAGMTLPQVIAVIDKRLITLETFMKDEINEKIAKDNEPVFVPKPEPDESKVSNDDFNSVIDEYSHRFNMLANEIAEMKDIILKLQSYTMDVNKVLMDERIHNISIINETVSTNNQGSNDSSHVPSIQSIANTQPSDSIELQVVQNTIETDFPKAMEISNLIPPVPQTTEVETLVENTQPKHGYKYNKKSK